MSSRTVGFSFALSVLAVSLLVAGPGLSPPKAPAPTASPQNPPQAGTFRTGTTLVEVDAIVKDPRGRFVSDLTAADFDVSEGGQPQVIETFYRVEGGRAVAAEEDSPASAASRADAVRRVFVLWIDLEHMAPAGVVHARAAAAEFLDAQFRPADLGGILAGGKLLNDRLTSNAAELKQAVLGVKASGEVRSREQDMREWPRFTSLYEAQRVDEADDRVIERLTDRACKDEPDQCRSRDDVRLTVQAKGRLLTGLARAAGMRTLATAQELVGNLVRLPGRKTVVYLSDGFYSEDLAGQLRSAIDRAATASVRFYGLDTRGLNRGASPNAAVEQGPHAPVVNSRDIGADLPVFDIDADGPNSLAVDTGGLMIRNENDFSKALREIADDTSSYYVLGYRPSRTALDGKYRSINVRVKKEGLSVRARKGYLAVPLPANMSPVPAAALLPEPTVAAPTPAVAPVPSPSGIASPAGGAPDAAAAATVPSPAAAPPSPGVHDESSLRLGPDSASRAGAVNQLHDVSSASGGGKMPAALAEQMKAGWEAYQRGDTRTASQALVPVSAHAASPAWVHFVLGWSAFAEGDFVSARNAWNIVRTMVPEFQPVYYDIADAYLRQKRPREALVVLRQAAARWPSDLDVWNAIGVVQLAAGDLDDAVASFTRATTLTPSDTNSIFNLASAREARFAKGLGEPAAREADRAEAIAGYRRVVETGGPQVVQAQHAIWRLTPIDARGLKVGRPVRIALLARKTLVGLPVMLAWSPDGQSLYLKSMSRDSTGVGHLLVSVADGKISQPSTTPDWAAAYWRWKAAQHAPWLPALVIKSETRRLSGFNSATDVGDNRRLREIQTETVSNVFALQGEVIASSPSGYLLPGLTFGWSPAATGAIVFVNENRGLTVMDSRRRKQRVNGAVDALLPGWSDDGARLACLARQGYDYELYVMEVTY